MKGADTMIRIDIERARGGAMLGRMRRVLIIGMALAVGAMTLIAVEAG